MNPVERAVRFMAGAVILGSLALAHWVSPKWIWLTVFVGLNLFQSAITRWCMLESILNKLGWSSNPAPKCSE
jgi:hypothetical protein